MALYILDNDNPERCGLCGRYLTHVNGSDDVLYCKTCGSYGLVTLPPYDRSHDWITPDGARQFVHTSGNHWMYYDHPTGLEDMIIEHELPGDLIPFEDWKKDFEEQTRIFGLYGKIVQLTLGVAP